MIIVPGQAMFVVKTGCKFSLSFDDRVFTGDLNFDRVSEDFVMRGIPSQGNVMTSILSDSEKRPYKMDLFVEAVSNSEVRPNGRYMDLKFRLAKCSYAFATFVEEWSNDPMVRNAMEKSWTFVPNLYWIK